MATFPRTESEITALARRVMAGLAENAEVFPAPTVPVAELKATYDAFIAAMLAAQDAEAAAKLRYVDKAKALTALVDVLKSDLRYAENVAPDDNELVKLGWGGRRPRTPLGVPGQVLGLEIVEEGAGSIALRWKKPVDGGAVAAYKVQVRHRAGGEWQQADTALHRKIRLTDQPRGVSLEYRVIAVNRAGEGKESGLAYAVL
jgi:hypothetical protein